MDKKDQTKLFIALAVAIVLVFIGQILLNKYLKIMLLSKLVPFILASEGGMSRDPEDKASKYPSPWTYKGQTGWHTNKGITYQSFVGNAKKMGYAPTKENFIEMPHDIWLKVLEGGYMAKYPLKKIDHLPRIQAVIITWAWGSGVSGSEHFLADFQRDEMGVQDSNITPEEIVQNFFKKVNPLNEKEWFKKLCDRREADFKNMPTFPTHSKGWLSRLAKFRILFN